MFATLKPLLPRLLSYFVALLIMSFGISFSVASQLGVSPVSSLPFAVSQVTGVSMGTMVTSFFIFFILCQILLLRKDYRWINLSQLLVSFVFGYLVDFANWVVLPRVIPVNYLAQLGSFVISVVFISFGLTLYVRAQIMVLPPEGVLLALIQRKHTLTFSRVKMMFDSVMVLLALTISWSFLGHVDGIREGTIISAFAIGRMVPMHTLLIEKVGRMIPIKRTESP